MSYFIFRNSTIENIFGNSDCNYSGYDDIYFTDADHDAYLWFYLLPNETSPLALVTKIEAYFNDIQFIYSKIKTTKPLIILTLEKIYALKYLHSDFSVQTAINAFNKNIIDFAKAHKNVKIIDFSDFTQHYSSEQLIDWKYYFVSKMQINPRLAKPLKNWYLKQVEVLQFNRKKCLVMDLDNTVWGGNLGDEGMEGIKVGGDYPGNAFLMFQQNLVELSKTGVILAVCSKNNEQDVLDVWKENPYLKLTNEHISAYRINWKNKADNIKELSIELNIGLDSIVFIDDNPAERELVKLLLPMVEVPHYPEQPYNLPHFFTTLQQNYFGIYETTTEDLNKTEQYKTTVQRADYQQAFSSFTDYLTNLQIVLTIQKATNFNTPRIAQLTHKTNQFNLTTKRYNESDIDHFVNQNERVYCLSEKDKFGDNGIVGVLIINNLTKTQANIDSLLLSCRVLGKGIENAFVQQVFKQLKNDGFIHITAHYIPTTKNSQACSFYDKIGGKLTKTTDGTKHYLFDLQNIDLETPPYYKIELQ